MCPVIFSFGHNILINFDGRCYAIFVKADVMPWLMLLPCMLW